MILQLRLLSLTVLRSASVGVVAGIAVAAREILAQDYLRQHLWRTALWIACRDTALGALGGRGAPVWASEERYGRLSLFGALQGTHGCRASGLHLGISAGMRAGTQARRRRFAPPAVVDLPLDARYHASSGGSSAQLLERRAQLLLGQLNVA